MLGNDYALISSNSTPNWVQLCQADTVIRSYSMCLRKSIRSPLTISAHLLSINSYRNILGSGDNYMLLWKKKKSKKSAKNTQMSVWCDWHNAVCIPSERQREHAEEHRRDKVQLPDGVWKLPCYHRLSSSPGSFSMTLNNYTLSPHSHKTEHPK